MKTPKFLIIGLLLASSSSTVYAQEGMIELEMADEQLGSRSYLFQKRMGLVRDQRTSSTDLKVPALPKPKKIEPAEEAPEKAAKTYADDNDPVVINAQQILKLRAEERMAKAKSGVKPTVASEKPLPSVLPPLPDVDVGSQPEMDSYEVLPPNSPNVADAPESKDDLKNLEATLAEVERELKREMEAIDQLIESEL